MARRDIPSSRSKTGGTSSTDQLRDQFIRELTDEAQKILSQFSQDLQAQSSQILSDVLGNGGGTEGGLGGLGQLFSTGTRYLVNRPTTSTTTVETAASQNATAAFRLSQSQTLAEANTLISKGDKNL